MTSSVPLPEHADVVHRCVRSFAPDRLGGLSADGFFLKQFARFLARADDKCGSGRRAHDTHQLGLQAHAHHRSVDSRRFCPPLLCQLSDGRDRGRQVDSRKAQGDRPARPRQRGLTTLPVHAAVKSRSGYVMQCVLRMWPSVALMGSASSSRTPSVSGSKPRRRTPTGKRVRHECARHVGQRAREPRAKSVVVCRQPSLGRTDVIA